MRIFAPSHLLQSYSLLDALKEIQGLGFRGSEIWFEHLEDKPPKVSEIKDLSLEYTFHAPSWDVNPTSLVKAAREFSINLILESLNFADQIGAKVAVVHPGHKSNPKNDFTVYKDYLLDFLSRYTKRCLELGLTPAAEIMDMTPNQLVNTPETANELTEKINGLTICFDLAHAGRFHDPLEQLKNIKNVSHFHLSNTTPRIPHTSLAHGILNIKVILDYLQNHYPEAIIANEGYDPNDELGLVTRNRDFLISIDYW